MGARRHVLRGTALAVLALAGCSEIGDGPNGSADARPFPDRTPDAAARADAAGPDAGPALLETLTVPSDGTAALSAAAAETGRTYRLEATGVFEWGLCDATNCPGGAACNYERYGDAYHRTDDCWTTTTAGFAYISLYLDGQQIDWGPYSADHVYSIELPGTGAPLELEVFDCVDCYLDNSGQLEVAIYLLPPG